MQQQVSLDLMEFIETQILPRYNQFGKSHGLEHVTRVIQNSLALSRTTGTNIDMVYTIAAYHDLGMIGPRAIHHITGGKILASDARLKKWFTPEQIKVMKEAVEDHRASMSRAPRSLYGKIIAEADRDLEPEVVFRRAIEYELENDPQKSEEEQWQDFLEHMNEKYSRNGYIHLWIPGSSNEKNLKIIHNIIDDPTQLRKIFNRIFGKLKQNE
nr:HD domain-containing protein [uncultured Prevotella sp.]